MTVTRAVTGSGWIVRLDDARGQLQIPCGNGRWEPSTQRVAGRQVPTAASGGWTGPATFTVEVAFTATPHRLVLVADVPSGLLQWRWRVAPLGDDVQVSDLAILG